MFRYALFALPGPGDAVIRQTQIAGTPPALLVAAGADDFQASPLPRVIARDVDLENVLNDAGIEAIVVAGWESRIPETVYLNRARGGWNIHPSLLPAYRGHNPYFHAIKDGVAETGVTFHALSSALDEGPMLLQKRLAVRSDETLGSLWARLAQLGAEALIEALPFIERGNLRLDAQPAGTFPLAPKVQPHDLLIRPTMSMDEARRLVRAANPFYGAFFPWQGRMLKVFEATPLAGSSGTAPSSSTHSTLPAESVDGPVIALADGHLVATILDLEGVGIVSGRHALAHFKSAG